MQWRLLSCLCESDSDPSSDTPTNKSVEKDVFECGLLGSTMFTVVLGLLLFFINPKVDLDVKGEQRVTLKFLVKSGKSPIQAWRQLHEVWGDRTLSKTQTRFWHKRF